MGSRRDLEHQSAIPLFLAVCAHPPVTASVARPEDDDQQLVQRVFLVSVFAFLLASPMIGRLKHTIFSHYRRAVLPQLARVLPTLRHLDWSSLVRPVGDQVGPSLCNVHQGRRNRGTTEKHGGLVSASRETAE